MNFITSCLIALLVCSCSKESLNITRQAGTYTWNRELYRVTPSYKYINNVRITGEPNEQFISYDLIELSAQQAQHQQDSLFKASKGRYLYRFKKVNVSE